jgi:phosphate transport system substrate-binding protein
VKSHRHTLGIIAALGAVALMTGCSTDAPPADAPTTDSGAGTTNSLSGALVGAGATSQESAVQAWIAGFQSANPAVTISYDPVGSGGGRTQFTEGGIDFGGTDTALDDDEWPLAEARCAPGIPIELPLYISPIAVAFNLSGIESLNMSPATIAGIFNGDITSWDAPEIAEANPDVDLPSLAITPVNRSDESGTTKNFTEYLAAAAGGAWPHDASGDWPVSGTQSAQGTSGVVQTVQSAEGAITYADASKVGQLGTVAVEVGDEYVPYSPEAAAAVVDASPLAEGRAEGSLVRVLERDTTAAGVYPIVLVSYTMACTAYDDAAKASLVKAFLTYVASEEGQEVASTAAGSAPISAGIRSAVMALVEQIG